MTLYKQQENVFVSSDYCSRLRILAKPHQPGSVLLICKELQPPVEKVYIKDANAVVSQDGIVTTSEKGHYEYRVQEDYVQQTELTPEQIAAGWTHLFSLETITQYKADNAAAIAAEVAAMTPPIPESMINPYAN